MVSSRLSPAWALPELLARWNALGVTDVMLSTALGVAPRALVRWREGIYPQTATRSKVEVLSGLYQRLSKSFSADDEEALHAWLFAENRFLGGLRPVEALRASRFDRVEAALTALDEGFFV